MSEQEALEELVWNRARNAALTMIPSKLAMREARKQVRAKVSAKSGVGVRVVQAYFILMLAGALAYAFVTSPSDFAYDFSMVHGMATAALSAVAIWLLQSRVTSARPFCIGAAIACVVMSVIDMFALGAFSVVADRFGEVFTCAVLAAEYAGAAFVVAYLLVSDDARTVLSKEPDREPLARIGYSFDEPLKQRVRTWTFWRDLMMYFFVFSFMGHWAEMLFCYNIHLGVFMGDVDFSEVMLWHQWLFPYCAEGVAVVLIAVLLTPVKQALLKVFGGRVLPAVIVSIVVTAAVCTTIDFTCGMICNQNYEVWDYRALPFNFMGQVCLQNSTVYTIAATLILWVFYPLMDKGLRRMPLSVSDGLFFALLGVYVFSALLHFMYVGDVGFVVGAFEM